MATMDVFIAETEEIRNAIQTMIAGFKAIDDGKKTFQCPICGGVAKCWKSGTNGHRDVYCPGCEVEVQE